MIKALSTTTLRSQCLITTLRQIQSERNWNLGQINPHSGRRGEIELRVQSREKRHMRRAKDKRKEMKKYSHWNKKALRGELGQKKAGLGGNRYSR